MQSKPILRGRLERHPADIGGNLMTTTSRRAVLAGIASASTLIGTVPATASIGPDPVYAAMEAHRAASAEFARRAQIVDDDMDNIRPDDLAAYQAASDNEDRTAIVLADIEPRTLAGAIALLEYCAEAEVKRQFPGDLRDEKGRPAPLLAFVCTNVVAALSRLQAGAA
jgi:hypothetical protein